MSDSEEYSDSDRSSEYSGYSDDTGSSSDNNSYDSDDYSDSDSDSGDDDEYSDDGSNDSGDDGSEDDEYRDDSSADDDSSDEEASTVPDENQKEKSESQPNAQEAAQRIQRAFRNYRTRKDALLDFDPNDFRFSREELIERAVRVLLAPDIQPRAPSLVGLPFKSLQWKPPRWHSLVRDTTDTVDFPREGFLPDFAPSYSADRMKITTEGLQIYDQSYRYRDRYNVDIIQPPTKSDGLSMINTRLPPPPVNNTAASVANYSGIVINNPYSTSGAFDTSI